VGAGFVGAVALRTTLTAEEKNPNKIVGLDAIEKAARAEEKKPKFAGDIDGMFLAPAGTPVPETYVTFDDVCTTPFSEEVSWDRAGELDLKLDLPKEYVLQPDHENTGVIACGDTVYTARRVYTAKSGWATIGRSYLTTEEVDVAVDRPKILHINGRDVVMIEPMTAEGTFQNSYAWFPEPFGDTFVYGHGLSQNDFTALVKLVASSTR
jgi:hypothetical protein